MARPAWWMVAILLFVGCAPSSSGPPAKPTAVMPTNGPEGTVAPVTDPPPEPEPKKKLPPPQTFAPPEDKAVTALKDVPPDELTARLGDEKQREAATRALVQRGADAVAPLTKALETSDPQARAAAAFALGQLGKDGAEVIPVLKKVSESDESELVRDAATFALDAIEGK